MTYIMRVIDAFDSMKYIHKASGHQESKLMLLGC